MPIEAQSRELAPQVVSVRILNVSRQAQQGTFGSGARVPIEESPERLQRRPEIPPTVNRPYMRHAETREPGAARSGELLPINRVRHPSHFGSGEATRHHPGEFPGIAQDAA